MPHPIQDATTSDRLRRFFRLRGKTNFSLDEMVVPVVVLQDLQAGQYPERVQFAARSIEINPSLATNASIMAVGFGSLTTLPENDPTSGLFTIDQFSVGLVDGSALANSQFTIGLGDKDDLAVGGVASQEGSFIKTKDWSFYPGPGGRRTIPIFLAGWADPLALVPTSPIARMTTGGGGQNGIQKPNIVISPREAFIVQSVIPNIKWHITVFGHWDPEPTA